MNPIIFSQDGPNTTSPGGSTDAGAVRQCRGSGLVLWRTIAASGGRPLAVKHEPRANSDHDEHAQYRPDPASLSVAAAVGARSGQFMDHGLDHTDFTAERLCARRGTWGGPAPTPSGIVYSTAGTIGLVYTFTFDHHYR